MKSGLHKNKELMVSVFLILPGFIFKSPKNAKVYSVARKFIKILKKCLLRKIKILEYHKFKT